MLRRALGLAVVGLLAAVVPAGATTFTVTKAEDTLDGACDADCSLREAITAANTDLARDEIVLLPTTMRIERPGADEDGNTTGDLDITRDVTLRGASAAGSVLHVLGDVDRVLDIQPGAIVTGTDLAVAGGLQGTGASGAGGGIRTAGDLTLERAVVRDNEVQGAAAPAFGGGINIQDGRLTLRDVTIRDNDAVVGIGYGGGLFIGAPLVRVALTNVTITGNRTNNHGAGMYSNYGFVGSFEHVTVSGNDATGMSGHAGGLGGDLLGLRIRSSIVSGNTATADANCDGGPYIATSDGGNVGPSTCGFTNITDNPADALLAPPSQDPIPVLEPQPGSPALDRAVGACPAADARGVPRPQGPACDAGAAERVVPPPLAPPAAPPAATPETAAPPVVATPVTAAKPGAKVRARRGGTLTLDLTAPGPGRWSVKATFRREGKAITYASRTRRVAAAGTTTLTVAAGRRAKAALRNRGRLRVTVTSRFTPTGGTATATSTALTVRR